MKSAFHVALCAGALVSCVHVVPTPQGPEAVARAYADALEQGRVDEAFALSAGVDLPRFKALYGTAAQRSDRVAVVRKAALGEPTLSPLQLVVEQGSWRVAEPDVVKPQATEPMAAALTQFLDDAERGDFESALKQLAPGVRARYSPQRFKDDFAREPLAKERLSRARAALQTGAWVVADRDAQLNLGGGKAVRLSKEGDAWRVVALE